MPLITMSLLAPVAHAMPSTAVLSGDARNDIILVQEESAPPKKPIKASEAGEGEEQPRRRPAREPAPEGSEPRRPTREAAPEGAEPRRPSREAAPEGGERPRNQRNNAESGEQPAERPARNTRPSDSGEKPAAERPARNAQPAEKPAAERPVRNAQPNDSGEKPAAERPARNAQPAEKPATERPVRNAQPTDSGAEPAERPARNAQPAEKPAAERPVRNAQPNDSGAEPAERPVRDARPNDGDAQPAERPVRNAQPNDSGAEPAERPGRPVPGDTAERPARGGGEEQARPRPPRTPEEIERAKVIAKDPASSDQTVVLPVENGAAVLDSAKEEPVRRPRGENGRPGGRDQQADGQGRPGDQRDGDRNGPRGGDRPRDAQQADRNDPPARPPRTDAEAQRGGDESERVRIEAVTSERGERMRERPRYERGRGLEDRRDADDGRVIIQLENRTIVRHDDSRRFYGRDYQPEYERLRDGRTREVIERDNGVRIVTIRNRYGDIVQRSRIDDNDREYVLYYAPEVERERGPDYEWRDPGVDLPPMRLSVPVSEYIIDTTSEPNRDYYEFLEQPPVERVERVYSLDEVKYSARIRDKVRRIDLDTITFATGSAEIPMNQATSLRKVADAIQQVLEKDPSETFLIEGHTDAVGSDDSNLVLSDRRAESVAVVLSDAFGIPPENLATQGYGERYLKVRTEGPAQENRRVTIRRITPLVKPVAQAQ
jgi:outer membrane protein OmpA-like peptidoglycan-associated protein